MSFYVVADLHIRSSEDRIYRQLLDFISAKTRPGDRFVIGGDLFDLFVGGRRIFIRRFAALFSVLGSAAARGINIHYVEGNHDFLVRSAFRGISGITVHQLFASFEHGNRHFYVAHGDTVDRHAIGYRMLRLFFRCPLMRAFIAFAPETLVDGLGQYLSARSNGKSSRHNTSELRRKFRNFATDRLMEGHDFVVLGHSHDADEMFFNIAGRAGQYINAGDAGTDGAYLAWQPGESAIKRLLF